MKVHSNRGRKEEGMSFTEVMICLVVVALVIGPFCLIFSSANKTRQTSVRIEEATCYGETLLAQIGDQITKDMILMQQIEGNRLSGAAEENMRYQDYIQKYLKQEPLDQKNEKLQVFLQMSDEAYQNAYHTERYTYEVVLWPLSKAPIEGEALEMTKDAIYEPAHKAVRLYSSDDPDYQLKKAFYEGKNKPISFSVSDDVMKAFKDSSGKYIVSAHPDDKYVLMNTLAIKAKVDKTSGLLKWEGDLDEKWGGLLKKGAANNGSTEIKDVQVIEQKGNVQELDLTIGTKNAGAKPLLPAGSQYLGVVKLDLTELLRNVPEAVKGSEYRNYQDLVIKVVNETGCDQVVQMVQNQIADDEETPHFKVLVEDAKDSDGKTGKSYQQTISDLTTEENYIVAVVIRELNPLMGRKGKIIKKMLDLYSYDPTILARR